MSSNRDESLSKRKTKPEGEEEVKATGATSKPEGKKTQETKPSGGFKAGWLVGGSILILVLALLYTKNVEQGAQKKDHTVRETEQKQPYVPEQDADYKGYLQIQEKWKGVFKLDKVGPAIQLYTQRCSGSYDEDLSKVVQDIGEHTNVKNFTLKAPLCRGLTENGIIKFSESVGKYLSKIEFFDFTFNEQNNLTDTAFKSLATSISQNLHNLKHLALWFQACTSIANGLSDLASAMDKFPRDFQNFSLTFIYNPKLTPESVNALTESIGRNFPKLTHFKLSFRVCEKLGNGIIEPLSKSLSKFKDLEGLSLAFGEVKNIATPEVQLLTDGMAGLSKLKSVELIFTKAKLLTESVEILSNAISKHNGLTELSLDFSGCSSLYDDSFSSLSQAFNKKLPKLKVLSLNFFNLELITDEFAQEIASILSQDRKGLEEFSINLSLTKKITGEGISAISKSIAKNLHNLQKLSFAIPVSQSFDGEAVKNVASIFSSKLSGLRELNLFFKGYTANGDNLSVLADNIGNNLINLEKFAFELFIHRDVLNPGMKNLAEAIGKRLPKLQELDLQFREVKMDVFTIAAFIDSLSKSSQNLRVLGLALDAVHDFTDDLVLQLAHTIGSHMTNLERFQIGLNLMSQVTDKSVKSIQNMLSGLPKLQLFGLQCYRAHKVTNAAMIELGVYIVENYPNINRVTVGLPKKAEKDENTKYREQLTPIPAIIL